MNYPNYPTYFGGQNQNGQQFQPGGGMPPRPDMNYQQQTQNMMQQAQMQPIAAQTVPQQFLSPSSRIVASREEAEAVTADFSGAPIIFRDIAHDCVYIKQWDNASGSALFLTYTRADGQNQSGRSDIKTLYDMMENLMQDVDRLKKSSGKAGNRSESDDE